MKHKSILRMFTAAVLCCTLCGSGLTVPAFSADENEELPAKFDLRDEGAMTPAKRQSHNGCELYAGYAAIESRMIKQGMADASLDLSEDHCLWFTYGKGKSEDPDDPLFGDGKDRGTEGYQRQVFHADIIATLGSWRGLALESEVPIAKESGPLDESLRYVSVAHLQNSFRYNAEEWTDFPLIKKQIMEKGALAAHYYDISSPNLYSEYGGFYQPYYNEDNKRIDPDEKVVLEGGGHVVCVCGWDDNFPKEHFVVMPPADGAWLCKNSWGANWGKTWDGHGYFYLSYYDPSISIKQYDIEPVDNYDGIYQRCGAILSKIDIENAGWGFSNIYTAKKDENLTAVSFFNRETHLPYEFSIYALKDGYTNPRDGELLAQISGVEPHLGYHTYPLQTACSVSAGQMFSVVAKTGIKESARCFFDNNPDNSGTSYYMTYDENGESEWKDATAEEDKGNVFLKVFTKDGTAVNEQNYPDPLYRKAAADAYDKNGDYVITEKEYAEGEQYLCGDLNRDGKVNAVDLSLLKQMLLGSERTDLCLLAGDWNEDQAINAEDARGVLGFLQQADI